MLKKLSFIRFLMTHRFSEVRILMRITGTAVKLLYKLYKNITQNHISDATCKY